jgi:hypothetical protein
MSVVLQHKALKFEPKLLETLQVQPALEVVQDFLDSAILAAWHDASPTSMPPALTPIRWVWRLAGSYHTTHSTPMFLRQAAERFVAAGRWHLAQWASERANEEQGHDQLALLDIQAMGYDPQLVVNRLVPSAAIALVNYFAQQVEAADPIGCVGYSYVLERLATRITASTIQDIEAILPPGIQATRCLRVHSSVGADADHVRENVEMIAKLSLAEQCDIAIACYETAKLCFTKPHRGYVSEAELQQRLDLYSKPVKFDTTLFLNISQAAYISLTSCRQNSVLIGVKGCKTRDLNNLLKNQFQAGFPNDLDEPF